MRKKLKLNIKTLKDKMAGLRKELKEEQLKLDELEFDMKLGDIVDYQCRKYKVYSFGYLCPAGHPIKKNGEASRTTRHLYNIKRKI